MLNHKEMKKKNLITTVLLSVMALLISSCLKDSRFVDFSKAGTIVEFPLGGKVYFSQDAVTANPDTDANGTITQQFAVTIASPTVPTTATTVTFNVDDPAIVTAYNASNSAVVYLPMPANAYSFTQTSVTIPAGQRNAILTVKFYKKLLDPSKSYMLPIAIKSAGGLTISSNMGIHYYHFIGNDFAGNYEHYFDRWSIPDSTQAAKKDNNHVDKGIAVFSPVSPTEFTVPTFYYTGPPFDVTFTKTGSGATATYSNFQVDFTAQTINDYFTVPSGGSVSLAHHPEIRPMNNVNYDPTKQYTYAQALLLFRFYYTTGTRAVIDTYVKP
jgi:hypothetical protein